jgi:hypothetical protein
VAAPSYESVYETSSLEVRQLEATREAEAGADLNVEVGIFQIASIPHHETFSTTIQLPYSSTKGLDACRSASGRSSRSRRRGTTRGRTTRRAAVALLGR